MTAWLSKAIEIMTCPSYAMASALIWGLKSTYRCEQLNSDTPKVKRKFKNRFTWLNFRTLSWCRLFDYSAFPGFSMKFKILSTMPLHGERACTRIKEYILLEIHTKGHRIHQLGCLANSAQYFLTADACFLTLGRWRYFQFYFKSSQNTVMVLKL